MTHCPEGNDNRRLYAMYIKPERTIVPSFGQNLIAQSGSQPKFNSIFEYERCWNGVLLYNAPTLDAATTAVARFYSIGGV